MQIAFLRVGIDELGKLPEIKGGRITRISDFAEHLGLVIGVADHRNGVGRDHGGVESCTKRVQCVHHFRYVSGIKQCIRAHLIRGGGPDDVFSQFLWRDGRICRENTAKFRIIYCILGDDLFCCNQVIGMIVKNGKRLHRSHEAGVHDDHIIRPIRKTGFYVREGEHPAGYGVHSVTGCTAAVVQEEEIGVCIGKTAVLLVGRSKRERLLHTFGRGDVCCKPFQHLAVLGYIAAAFCQITEQKRRVGYRDAGVPAAFIGSSVDDQHLACVRVPVCGHVLHQAGHLAVLCLEVGADDVDDKIVLRIITAGVGSGDGCDTGNSQQQEKYCCCHPEEIRIYGDQIVVPPLHQGIRSALYMNPSHEEEKRKRS